MPARLTIEIVAAPQVNHAMAHNGLPFLYRLVVDASEPLEQVLLAVRVVDAFGVTASRPWQHFVERMEPGHPLAIEQPSVRLDPAYLAGVEEEIGAEIVVEVSAGDVPVQTAGQPIRVLAARQWTLDPQAPVLSLELLAAFVQPNHPALPPLISEAAQLLARSTGSGSLGVHYAGPQRIDEIVGAIFTAVHEPGDLLRRATRELGLRTEGPDTRRRAHRPGRHLPGHHDAAGLRPGARRRHSGGLGGPRPRVPRLLA